MAGIGVIDKVSKVVVLRFAQPLHPRMQRTAGVAIAIVSHEITRNSSPFGLKLGHVVSVELRKADHADPPFPRQARIGTGRLGDRSPNHDAVLDPDAVGARNKSRHTIGDLGLSNPPPSAEFPNFDDNGFRADRTHVQGGSSNRSDSFQRVVELMNFLEGRGRKKSDTVRGGDRQYGAVWRQRRASCTQGKSEGRDRSEVR